MCKYSPTYIDIIEHYRGPKMNLKDFAFKVKEYGLAAFVDKCSDPTIRKKYKISPESALGMISVAVKLGDCQYE